MIKWTDIDNEVEEFQSGYRSGFVAIFKKYEGMDTDEKGKNGAVLTVNVSSFASRYGIAKSTFDEWVKKETSPGAGNVSTRTRPGPDQRAIAEAAAKAKAEAEAKAAEALAKALAERDRQAKEAMRQERVAAEARAKAEAEKIRREEQAKAKAAAEKELKELRAKLAETAKAAEFDVSTLSEAQKAKVMTMLANDPEQAKQWFAAQTAERARKLAEQEKSAREAQAKKRQQMEEREARQAAEKARRDYDGSALRKLLDLAKLAKECQAILRSKGIDFDHILVSGRTAQEWINITEQVEDIAVEYREAIFDVNAKNELADLTE